MSLGLEVSFGLFVLGGWGKLPSTILKFGFPHSQFFNKTIFIFFRYYNRTVSFKNFAQETYKPLIYCCENLVFNGYMVYNGGTILLPVKAPAPIHPLQPRGYSLMLRLRLVHESLPHPVVIAILHLHYLRKFTKVIANLLP